MDEIRTVTRPYAKAVFELAAASETLTEWSDFLKECSELLKNNEIKALIKAPGQNKKNIAEVFYAIATLDIRANDLSQKQFFNLIQILSVNDRLNVMGELHKQYSQKKRESHNYSSPKASQTSSKVYLWGARGSGLGGLGHA